MKKNILLNLFFYTILVIILTGCVTTGMPAPKSDSDTLIVVPVVIIDGRKTPFEGEIKYTVYMDNIETGKTESFVLSTKNHGYFYLKGITPGKYSIQEYGTYGLQNDEKYDLYFEKYLVVNEGELTIFPGKLTVYIYNNESSSYDGSYLYYEVREMGEGQISRIENYLKVEESFSLWK